jgi:hypothetical protein
MMLGLSFCEDHKADDGTERSIAAGFCRSPLTCLFLGLGLIG